MYLNDHATSVATLPPASVPGTPGYFDPAPPGSGRVPTVVTADALNTLMEELLNIVVFAGMTPDKADNTQVLAAIQSIAGSSGQTGASSPLGMALSNTPGFTTTRITATAGICRDSSNTQRIQFVTPITKRLDALFAAGTGLGGRDTGALANGQTWHVFAILDPAGGAVDMLFSQSVTAPTMPAPFTKFRRLGSILLDKTATTIQQFIQIGQEFRLVTRSADFAAQGNGAGVPTLRQISVPNGIKVEALMYFQSTGTANTTAYLSGIYDPDMGVPAAFGGPTQWAQVRRGSFLDSTSAALSYMTTLVRQFTDTAQHVYTFSSDAGDVIALGVLGWRDDLSRLS